MDEYTWNWCHGPAGTLALFEALDAAGVADVAGEPPTAWVARCLHSLHTSGIPERRWPGFWDNDGRCCGTAGVGSAVLPHDPAFALRWPTTSSPARTSRATAPTGGSPSTATPSPCSRPASAGCRARPASPGTCSRWPATLDPAPRHDRRRPARRWPALPTRSPPSIRPGPRMSSSSSSAVRVAGIRRGPLAAARAVPRRPPPPPRRRLPPGAPRPHRLARPATSPASPAR